MRREGSRCRRVSSSACGAAAQERSTRSGSSITILNSTQAKNSPVSPHRQHATAPKSNRLAHHSNPQESLLLNPLLALCVHFPNLS